MKKTVVWEKKHLLGIEELSKEEIILLLDQAESFKEVVKRAIPKVPPLRGKTIVNLFCEPSTRTRTSFELAAKRLSADTVSVATSSSSFLKGETLKDTARNLEAMNIDMIIIRHSCAGAPKFLSECVNASVVNAGDGSHEHPTQALLDVFTLREKLKKIEGLKVSIIGDIEHSRVARSNIWALTKLGAKVTVCGPRTMMPAGIEKMGVKVTCDVNEALEGADAINVLRIQLERQKQQLFPSTREYVRNFGITKDRLKKHAKKDILILHPGPINRDVELSQDAADGEYSVILEQVTNGVAVRMAVLFLLSTTRQIIEQAQKE
ncbi:MAG TPA: aspartate carbamoyltransferase catalytic subunit [Candidatus Omnitrophota bacterium]|nr:aspartate carbamoyltransferase catalytic subunit [Candidatus Omnitrophota bacterium]HPS21034.1 aspartate carbamoyltransferase catalytic subunit [Candidatus Omnitrophota bacterium]